jgi:hypothetical protein
LRPVQKRSQEEAKVGAGEGLDSKFYGWLDRVHCLTPVTSSRNPIVDKKDPKGTTTSMYIMSVLLICCRLSLLNDDDEVQEALIALMKQSWELNHAMLIAGQMKGLQDKVMVHCLF